MPFPGVRWIVLTTAIAAQLACGPSLRRFATEREILGEDFPGEPVSRTIPLDLVYEEEVNVVYWDNQRDDPRGTLLFVHGIPNNKRTFLYLWQDLAPEYRVIAPDLPGFGFSSKPDLREAFPSEDVYSANTLGYFLVNFVDVLERNDAQRRRDMGLPPDLDAFRNLTIVANSYGCAGVMSALIVTPRFGDRVNRIIFISPAVYYQRVLETSRLRRMLNSITLLDPIIRGLRMDDRIAMNSFIRIFHNDYLENDPNRYRIPREQLEEIFRILNEPNFFHVIRHFSKNLNPWNYDRLVDGFHTLMQPTLIIAGERDQIVPNIFPRRLANDMPNSQLVVFPDCGHQPHLEFPFETNALIRNWLDHQYGGEEGAFVWDTTASHPTPEHWASASN
jgi:pimeloyl-ACP methyl ester carboxylesterase